MEKINSFEELIDLINRNNNFLGVAAFKGIIKSSKDITYDNSKYFVYNSIDDSEREFTKISLEGWYNNYINNGWHFMYYN